MLKTYVLISMRRCVYVYIFVSALFLCSFPLIAKAQDYGFSGEIRLTYRSDTFESDSFNTRLSSIEQKYRLNYTNFVYKPKLLTYSLGGAFIKENARTDGSNQETTGKEYNARLDFLSETPYPFSLWATKQSPSSFTFLSDGRTILVKQILNSYGLEGRFFFRGLPQIRYTFRQEDRKTVDTVLRDEREQNFVLNISQTWRNSSAVFNYEYKDIHDNITLSDRKSHDIQLRGSTTQRLSSVSHINANAEFRTNTFNHSTDISGNASLNYYPTVKLNETFTVVYSHINLPHSTSDSFLSLMHINYKLSRVFTTIGEGSFSYNTGAAGSNTTENLTGSLNYYNLIAKDLTLSAGASLGAGAQQGIPVNRTTVSTSLSSVLTKNLPVLRTTISTGGAAGYFSSSAGGKSENFYWDLVASSQLLERLTAVHQFRYLQEKTVDDTLDSVPGITTFTKKFVSDTSLSYFAYVMASARVDLKSGVLIEQGQGTTQNRKAYYADEIFNYNIMRNLFLRENLRYQFESNSLSTRTISFNTQLDYRIRKVFMALKYNWRNEEGDTTSTTITNLLLELLRPF